MSSEFPSFGPEAAKALNRSRLGDDPALNEVSIGKLVQRPVECRPASEKTDDSITW